MGLELLLVLPGRPFQVIVLEGVDEDFRLVQPGGIGRRIPRPPPALTLGEVPLRLPATWLDPPSWIRKTPRNSLCCW